jgi:EmrB/QacA subfamily drug resistance transporter
MTKTKHYGWALALISTAQLMVILDATIINIAIPHIQRDLGFSPSSLSWVITTYSLILAGFLLLGGRVGDLYGRRRAFIFGLILFAAASFAGGFAQDQAMLLTSRALQGLGAAFASPNALALIATTFDPGPRRSRAFAVYGMMSGLGAAIGLVLGGWLTSLSMHIGGAFIDGWRFTFLINVPIGIAAAIAAPLLLTESDRHPGKLDVPGAITATLGLLSLVFGITHAGTQDANGNQYGWTGSLTLGPILVGLALLATFVLIETRVKAPMLPFRLLRNRDRGAAYILMLFTASALFANFIFLSLLMQNVLGYSALSTGVKFLPWSLTMIAFATQIPRLLHRFDPGKLSAVGGIIGGIGMLGLSRAPFSTDVASLGVPIDYWTHIFPWIVIAPIGMALLFIPTTMSVVHRVPAQESGIASGVLNTMQQLGGALGLATLFTLALHYAHTMGASIIAQAQATQTQVDPAVVQNVAFAYGATRGFIFAGLLLFAAAVTAFFFNRIKHQDMATVHVPTPAETPEGTAAPAVSH